MASRPNRPIQSRALDPISWTPSERRIRCRRWRDKKPRRTRRSFTDEFKAGAVRLVLDEGKTVGRGGARLGVDGVVACGIGSSRPGRIARTGKTGLDDGRARGARAAPERESHPAGGAGDPKKGGSLLREGAAVRFRFIAAEKAHHSLSMLVSVYAGDAQRVLCLAPAAGVGPCAAGSAAEGPGAGLVRRQQTALRQPAHSPGSDRAAGAREPQTGDPVDAGGGTEGPGAQTVQVHDDERPRPAGRGQSPRSPVHRRRRPINGGSATRPSS